MKHARRIVKEGKLAYKEINNKLNVVIDEVKTLKENATREGRAIFPRNQTNNPNEYDVFVDLIIDENAEVSGRRGMFFCDISVAFDLIGTCLDELEENCQDVRMQQIDVMRSYIAIVNITARDAQVKEIYSDIMASDPEEREKGKCMPIRDVEDYQQGLYDKPLTCFG
ncbi:hypothetical protein GIB67_021447 [Kingdonia uniflora]|uniref:Uncharacterized protein n=1 Tax=Kingdonia uniflora TaxID=39325 RepID=A0A7J7NR62_9MAGN|nr:hypothetical protein GIB67_021447 [Kingdonia uniflora]